MNNPVRVLYLEDNPRDAELVQDTLQQTRLACDVRIVRDHAGFEAALRGHAFDLILSDYDLPSYDGLSALNLALATQPGVPFILISGALGEERAVDCVLRGATDFVLKQRMERLGPAVRRALSEAEERRQRRRAETALQESEARFRSLIEQAPEAIFVQSEGAFVYVNPSMLQLLGAARPEEVLGKDSLSMVAPEYLDAVRERIRLQRETGRPAPVMEMEYLRLDGTRVNVETTAMHIRYGSRPSHLVFVRDVTSRKRAEVEHERLMAAIEQSGEAIVITDVEGTMLYVNPAFEKSTGYTRAEALGQNPRILKSGRHDAEFYRRMWTVLSAGGVWTGHFTNKRKDGTLYEEDATISPVRNAAGAIANYVAVKRDVTQRMHLDEQLRQAQKMEAVGRLAGGVAHDFNNLLMGIMGYAELCLERLASDHVAREWLEEILSDARRSAELTRQLLAFARKQTIAPRILDLNEAVGSMLKLLRRLIGEDINLSWQPGAGLWMVKVDPSQVDQILANLCVNARDAIGGVGKITIETRNVTLDADYAARHEGVVPGRYVSLTVRDNGAGMDKNTLAQIFEPFFTTKGLGKGTGLGLSTVYGIVKQNNGFIYVDSEPGKGTTFDIHLPQAPFEAAADAAREEPVPRGRGETILLVEDEKSLRVTCNLFLDALGYKVLVAETPGEALRMAEQHAGDIDLLLTDVIMPGMDGRQLAERLVVIKPRVKVLFMSGYTADVIARRGVLGPNVAFIAKPMMRDALARKVREVLDAP